MNWKKKFPPFEPCSCKICVEFCRRPGWWSVEQAKKALEAGYAERIMLEVSPERTFGVLSPAFKGNEGNFTLQIHTREGSTFIKDNLCELFGTGLQPLECRFCHHARQGQGPKCHAALEKDWYGQEGQSLIAKWNKTTRLFERQGLHLGRRYGM